MRLEAKKNKKNKIKKIRLKDNILKPTKHRTIRDIKKLFEHEKEYYYKPVRVSNFDCNNYIEYESNGDKNKTLSIKEHLDETELYLKDIK